MTLPYINSMYLLLHIDKSTENQNVKTFFYEGGEK